MDFLYGNAAAGPKGGPTKFDPCTGLQIGDEVCLNNTGVSFTWGMHYDEMTGYVYTTANGVDANGDEIGLVYRYTLAQVDAAVNDGTCFASFVTGVFANATNSSINRIFGVTTDAAGNTYVVARQAGTGVIRPAQIFKYDSNGMFLGVSAIDITNYPTMMGIVYSMTTDQLYTSSNTFDGTDCISVFDTDLNYLGTGAANPPGPHPDAQSGKGISIIKECCPTPGDTEFNFSFCEEDFPGFIELSKLYECEGVVCEAPWVQSAPVMGVIYDDCKQAILEITPDFEGGCVTFTKGYTPPDATSRCEAFMITINVEIVKKATSTIAAPTICGSAFTSEITTDPGQATDMVTYQWQESTPPAAFVDISGATSATYTPPTNPLSTQCFRLITTTTGSCVDSDNAMCSDISNVVKFTINPLPTVGLNDPADVCEDGTTDFSFTATPSGGSFTSTAPMASFSSNGAAGTAGIDVMAAGPGTYSVTYEFTDVAGCKNDTTVSVTVNAAPTLIITDPPAVCSPAIGDFPETVDLTVLATGSSAGNLSYFSDAGLSVSVTTPTAVGEGTYYIQLTDATTGCSASGVVSVNMGPCAELIPTMSEWGLIIFGLLILNLGIFFLYRKKRMLNASTL